MEKQVVGNTEGLTGWNTLLKTLMTDIARSAKICGELKTAVPGLNFYHYDSPTEPKLGLQEPSICLVAQGAKKSISKTTLLCMTLTITCSHLYIFRRLIRSFQQAPTNHTWDCF